MNVISRNLLGKKEMRNFGILIYWSRWVPKWGIVSVDEFIRS